MDRWLFFTILTAVAAAFHPKIDESLHRGLRERETNDVMIVLKKTTNSRRKLEALNPRDRNRGGKIASRVKEMEKDVAERSQSVLNVLGSEARSPRSVFQKAKETSTVTFKSHWIIPQISVQGASKELLETLADLDDVELIRAPKVIPMENLTSKAQPQSFTSPTNSFTNPIYDEAMRRLRAGENQWGIEKIEAPRTWESFNKGEGVVVASIDTGVRGSSIFLKNSYVGAENFGWYDPHLKTQNPTDFRGRGTHVMGSVVGSNGLGVAPEAKWMACAACDQYSCHEERLIACAEFVACPHDYTGDKTTTNCSKTPSIVHNSWGVPGDNSFYQDIVNTWHELGIIPVFANGDSGTSGSSCGTTSSPGDYANVISVGSTTSNDEISAFSSKGPSVGGLVKPDVTAPGEDILSASNAGDDSVEMLSGTSMAASHVSGMIALMLSANKTRKYDDIFAMISASSETNALVSSGMTCGGISDTTFPNNIFGHGRINAYDTLVGQTPAPESPTPSLNPAPTPEGPTPAPDSPTPAPSPAPAPDSDDDPAFDYSDKIDDALKKDPSEKKEIVIHFTNGVSGLPMVNRGNFKERIEELNAKGAELYKTVFDLVKQSEGVSFEYKYIGPALQVHNAPSKLIYELGELPDVRYVSPASSTPVNKRFIARK